MKMPEVPGWFFWVAYVGLLLFLSWSLEHVCPWPHLRPLVSVGVMIGGGIFFVFLVHGLPVLTAILTLQRNLDGAEKNARFTLAFHRTLAPTSRDTALQLSLLAEVLRMQCRFGEAESAILESLNLLTDLKADSQEALAREILGAIMRDQGKNSAAVQEGQKACEILEILLKDCDEKSSDYQRLRRALAHSCLELGRSLSASASADQALEVLHRSLDLRDRTGELGRQKADVFTELARAYLQLGEYKEAECAAQSALELLGAHSGLPQAGQALSAEDELAYARALAAAFAVVLQAPEKSREERSRAEGMLAEANNIRRKWLRPGDPELRN